MNTFKTLNQKGQHNWIKILCLGIGLATGIVLMSASRGRCDDGQSECHLQVHHQELRRLGYHRRYGAHHHHRRAGLRRHPRRGHERALCRSASRHKPGGQPVLTAHGVSREASGSEAALNYRHEKTFIINPADSLLPAGFLLVSSLLLSPEEHTLQTLLVVTCSIQRVLDLRSSLLTLGRT